MTRLCAQDIDRIQQQAQEQAGEYIRVGMSTCGVAAGADEVYQALVEEAQKRKVAIAIHKCGCLGMCYAEPLVEVRVQGLPVVVYGRVTRDIAHDIIEKHVCNKVLVNDAIFELEVR